MMDILGFISAIGGIVAFISLIIQAIRKKGNKKIWAIVFGICLVVFVVSMALAPDNTNSDKSKEAVKHKVGSVAEYDDCKIELKDAIKATDENGNNIIRIHAVFTNDKKEPLYGLSCFAVRAFQDDKELEDMTDINGEDKNLTVEIKNGKSIDVSYAYKLNSDKDVEVLIRTPTASQDTIGKKIYTVK